ncbi:hypothetical protein ACP275_09G002800 [Erythranthe tilingii]
MKHIYRFTLDNYSLCKRIILGKNITSSTFNVGGHEWAIVVFFQNKDCISGNHIYFGMCVTLKSSGSRVPFRYKLTLVDQSGEGNHLVVGPSLDEEPDMSPILIDRGQEIGFPCLVRHNVLEESSYLKDDRLKIECTLEVLSTEIMASSSISSVPQRYDLESFLLDMLESGEDSDVIFNVEGMEFRAHKSMLSACSSVFESMFASHLTCHQQQQVVITGIEPQVFKAMLHFIYSDALPEDERSLLDGYDFGTSVSSTIGAKLLAAADKFDVKRLKSMCESYLWRNISLSRLAETLMVAERCNASRLKLFCFGFAVHHFDDLEESDTYNTLKNNFPILLDELVDYVSKERVFQIEKQLPVAWDKFSTQ